MFCQHALAERIDLAERDGLKASGALQPKVETADACEQRKDAELGHAALASSSCERSCSPIHCV